jgi:hypothetical protein
MERERAAARFAVKPQLSAYTGMTLAKVAPMYLAERTAESRAALMQLSIRACSDALGALSIIESDDEDRELAARLLKGLRRFLSAD